MRKVTTAKNPLKTAKSRVRELLPRKNTGVRKGKTSVRTAKTTKNNVRESLPRKKTSVRRAKTPIRKANTAKNNVREQLPRMDSSLQEAAEPLFIDHPHKIEHSVPRYMPKEEQDLAHWMLRYAAVARSYVDLFPHALGADARFGVDKLSAALEGMCAARENIARLSKALHMWKYYKNMAMHSRDHTGNVTPPDMWLVDAAALCPHCRAALFSHDRDVNPNADADGRAACEAAASRGSAKKGTLSLDFIGLAGMIDWQVKVLRISPGFTAMIAEQLGIEKPRPRPLDTTRLDPQSHARFMGGYVDVRFHRSPRGKEVWGATVKVDRGDGDLQTLCSGNTHGSMLDHHPLPERETAWVYYVYYTDELQHQIGHVSKTAVIVYGGRQDFSET